MKSLESDVIELLASWGAVERPATAAILRALAGLAGPDTLRMLASRGRGLLSDSLTREIEQTLDIVSDGDAWRAPSFRARIDRLVAAAGDELRAVVESRRDRLATELGASAPFLPWEQLRGIFERIGSVDRARTPDQQVEAAEDLGRIHTVIEQARASVRQDLEELVSSSAESPATSRALERGRQALATENLEEISRALRELRGAGLETRVEEQTAALERARQELAALAGSARKRLAGSAPSGRGRDRLLEAVIEGAEKAAQANSGDPAHQAQVIACWEESLRGVLEPGEEGPGAEPDDQLSKELAEELDRQRARLGGTEAERSPAPPADAAQAMARIQELRTAADSALEKSSSGLSTTIREMEKFLEGSAPHLPTARVVQARLWIDQADGIIAGQDAGDIESLETTVRKELDELSAIAGAARRRQKDSEEADREALLEEIALLQKAASGRSGRRLEAMAADVRSAAAGEMPELEDRLADLRGAIEQPLRLEAGKTLHSCERWLSRGGRGNAEASEEMQRLRDDLKESLSGDDPGAIRDRAAELRARLLEAAPLKRPSVRIAVACGVLLLAAVGIWYAAMAPGSGRTYHVRFDSPPPAPMRVTIVKDGRVVGTGSYGPADAEGIAFTLDDGRYEVFVDDRYTGRTFLVPGDPEPIEIPRPVDAP